MSCNRKVALLASAMVVSLSVNVLSLAAQKPPLNHSTPETWPRLEAPEISADGRYVAYAVNVRQMGTTLIVKALDGAWQREIPGELNAISWLRFTEDSRELLWRAGADTLQIVRLGADSMQSIVGVNRFATPKSGSGEWLAYQLRDSARTLVLHNLHSGLDRRYTGVAEFEFSDNGQVLVLQAQHDSLSPQVLMYVETTTGRADTLARGRAVGPWLFDDGQAGFAFMVTNLIGDAPQVTVRYYAPRMDSARVVVDSRTPGLGELVVRDLVRVSRGGQEVFVNLEAPLPVAKRHGVVGTLVSEADSRADLAIESTQDEQRTFEHNREPLLAVVRTVPAPQVVRLQRTMDRGVADISAASDYVLIDSDAYGSVEEYQWRMTARPNGYLVSTRDGSRMLLRKRFVGGGGDTFQFSRAGKYVIWFDPRLGAWYTYNIAQGATHNITRGLPGTAFEQPNDFPDVPSHFPPVGWLADDRRVIVQGYYDIWAVDPEGKLAPTNLTQGVGTRQHIRFRCVDYWTGWGELTQANPSRVFHWGDTLLLVANDSRTKANGFYRLVLSRGGELTRLRMDAKAYYIPEGRWSLNADSPEKPQRAKHAERYILSAQSDTGYPNYYVTSDFQELIPVTHLAPQAAYNWYRTELVHWQMPDGHTGAGLLYKPANFDPEKKYPVLVYIYDQTTDALNVFVHPVLSVGAANVAWFVSNGYLVFIPDIIYYDRGHPGRSALNAVESGVAYLARFPWVNARKMGIQGHSFGGYETYYIVTHTSQFAAGAPAEGVTEIVSDYTLGHGPYWYEHRQGRIGASLWERPDLYIENSPIFKANQVTMPLLMLANAEDGTVPGRYGREMLIALHRQGKPAWRLDYHGEGHTLAKSENQLDYSIRLGQFFDYYLKDAPPPKWMTTSVADHSSDVSLELDTSGARP